MDNNKNVRPNDLSEQEWSILQHVASLGTTFYMADALLKFSGSILAADKLRNTILLNKSFQRLKTAGYIQLQLMAFADVTNLTRPLYALSAIGKKAIHQ